MDEPLCKCGRVADDHCQIRHARPSDALRCEEDNRRPHQIYATGAGADGVSRLLPDTNECTHSVITSLQALVKDLRAYAIRPCSRCGKVKVLPDYLQEGVNR